MAPNAHDTYLRTKVMTASKEQLVLMLFDGCIRFSEVAKKGWADKDLEAAHNAMVRAQNIVLELAVALDKEKGGELAVNMAGLYNYCYRQLVDANIEHDPERVDEVIGIVRELREAWAQAMDKVGASAEKSPDQVQLSTAPAPAASPAPAAPAGKVLAKIPVKKMAVPNPAAGLAPEDRPRLSVQG
ncbi:MAG: flagellar export chaperone FliS [Planctomycetota bacterium]|jgi:flagellar protein FliS